MCDWDWSSYPRICWNEHFKINCQQGIEKHNILRHTINDLKQEMPFNKTDGVGLKKGKNITLG